MPRSERAFQTLLRGIDSFLDNLLRTTDKWEEALHTAMKKEDKDIVLAFAKRGSDLGRLSKEARVQLLEAREEHKEDLSDGALDEANAAVEAKLDTIDAKLRRAIDEVMSRQEDMDARLRKSLEAMEGFGDPGIYSDNDDEEDMKKMREELKKDEKRKNLKK